MTWAAMDRLADGWQAADQWAETPMGPDEYVMGIAVSNHRHDAFEATWPLEGMLGRLALRGAPRTPCLTRERSAV
jgi:hypothetical protein